MDFSNEPYVRLYSRDSATWKRLGFDGQTCLMHLLRRANAIGVIELGDLAPWQAAAVLCDVPEGIARAGVDKLIQLGCAAHSGGKLVFPRYLDAQNAAASDAQRKRESRAREALIGEAVTKRDKHLVDAAVTAWDPDAGVYRRVTGDGPALAARGARWLSTATGLEPYAHSGRWYESLRDIGGKPEAELAAAAQALKLAAQRPDASHILTPRHVADYWHLYKAGKAPGGAKSNGNGHSDVDAARAESQRWKRAYESAASPHAKAEAMERWLAADRKLAQVKQGA